jgi:hypothetical protein
MAHTRVALIAARQHGYSRPATAMRIIPVAGAAALLLAVLAGCSAGAPSPAPPPTNPAAAGSSAAGGQTATTTRTTTDPCQLVTPQEASALTGASYGSGTERATGPGKTCVYGASTKNVFMVDLFQGSSGQLKLIREHVSAEITQGGHMTPTPVSGLGEGATAYHVTSDIFNGASIFVLKGTAAIYLVDEVTGGQAPTTAALTIAARTALGRLP